MTDYPHGQRNSWKKQEVARKWHTLLGVFVTVVLIFATVNGIVKTFSIGKFFGSSSWDAKSAFPAVVTTRPLSVLVYNPTSEEMTLVKLRPDLYFVTGQEKEPLAEIGKVAEGAGGSDLARLASRVTRSPIASFVILEEGTEVTSESLKEYFKSFASLLTPIRVMLSKPAGVANTNITRVDMIRLWWQVKSLGVNNLKFVDAASFQEEIVSAGGHKILGVDDVSLHRLFSKYLQNWTIMEERLAISIDDLSTEPESGALARDFILSVGGQVTGVNYKKGESVAQTFIAAGEDSYTVSYLAKIFECDIKALPNLAEGEIKVVIGRDFAQKLMFHKD